MAGLFCSVMFCSSLVHLLSTLGRFDLLGALGALGALGTLGTLGTLAILETWALFGCSALHPANTPTPREHQAQAASRSQA